MAKGDQVIRFGVGEPDGPRSGVWRVWVPKGTSDVYLSRRALGRHFKVSLHESGDWRAALTSEYVKRPDRNIVIEARDPRGPVRWERPEPQQGSAPATHAANIVVPWWEVRDRRPEDGDVVWADPPPEGWCVEFAVTFVPPEMPVIDHPGARAMNSKLVGEVELANGERVFVVWWTYEMGEPLRVHAERFRRARVHDAEGNLVQGASLLAFGIEDGIAMFLDVSNEPAEEAPVGEPEAGE